MRVPGGTTAPGDSGTAPTPRSGAWPAMAKDETTHWLASDPWLHGVFRTTLGNPTMCRAMRAVEIFVPMMLGTVTPGEVVDVVEEVVVVEEVGGSVVVTIGRSASFWSADGAPAHDESAQAARTAAAAAAADRIPACTDPSCCVGAAERVPSAATRVYFKMLTARATTRIATTREMASSAIIMSFIQGLTADTSVGLKAVAVAKAKWK